MKKIRSVIAFVGKHLRPFLKVRYLAFGFFGVLVGVVLSLLIVALATHTNPIPNKLEREHNNTAKKVVNDVTELNPVQVIDIIVPHTESEIIDAVKNHDRISIGGGRNSMGGQTASEKAVQIDMREYNKILSFSTSSKEITVQSGIRWRDIQDYIDPHGLSVKIMQTYSNFTVGGSLSVNVHGRYIGLGPIILSVKQFNIVLANGLLVTASPTQNEDIFYSAIGGMGGIGVITDVTLELADNNNVERSRVKMETTEYAKYFKENVRDNTKVLFHNGDMYPPAFEDISAVSWSLTEKEPTTQDRLIPRMQDYWKERIAWVVMSEWPGGRWIREHLIDPVLYSGDAPVHTRNYEASYDVAELEPEDRDGSTYVLQEYFVPVERFDEWVPKMKKVFNDNDVNVINVSIRHAFADKGAKLAWAPRESFAFVVYYKQGTDEAAKAHVGNWTRQMIDAVLSVDGRYYLPYQLHATDDQLQRAYPGLVDYLETKQKYDPANKFTNKLWDKYYSEEQFKQYKEEARLQAFASTTKEFYRAFDNAYLALPEWYIVYSADEYAAVLKSGLPSQFDYFGAKDEFWKQHERVVELSKSSPHNNEGYLTVLSVIGWSFTVENVIKGVYENTIGRASEWVAGDTKVPEDFFAAFAAEEYALFIYDYPWYDFPYFKHLVGFWTIDNTIDYTWKQNIRRIERKVFLTLEYGIKSLYSSVIRFATHTKFGVQDDVVYAIISRDDGQSLELLSAPHYHPFTRVLLAELGKEVANQDFTILSISGNKKITLTYRDVVGQPAIAQGIEVLRDTAVSEVVDGDVQYQDRITIEVAVTDIPTIYRALEERGIAIDHFYDY